MHVYFFNLSSNNNIYIENQYAITRTKLSVTFNYLLHLFICLLCLTKKNFHMNIYIYVIFFKNIISYFMGKIC